MIYGAQPVGEAVGAILVHSLRVGTRKLKKGHTLSADDVALLREAAIETVITVRLGDDDEAEDSAAQRIAEACRGTGTKAQAAFTGRCNLYAARRGLLQVDSARIQAVNRLHESITIATLPAWEVIEAGQMLATVKIIPFAAPRFAVDQAVALARSPAAILNVAEFKAHKVGLIMTRLADTQDKVLHKTRDVLAQRLHSYGSSIGQERHCAHQASAIAEALSALLAQGQSPILIFGASAITDRRDEIPAGIAAAGGQLLHFGMPVDPGNLLLLAQHGATPVIGLPGCARSPKLNGFDWILRRLLAAIEVTSDDITAMGVGGLLKEIPSRPQPRHGLVFEAQAPRAPRVAVLILAAGQSRRMGQQNKLLADIAGKPLLNHAVATAKASQATGIFLVTGYQAEAVRQALPSDGMTLCHNPDFAEGLSSSLKTGLAAIAADARGFDACLVLLGDMPAIGAQTLDRLIAAFDPLEGRAIIVPTHQGKRGNPVLFASHFIAELMDLAGDVGAKSLLGAYEDQVAEVAIEDGSIFLDVDTPQSLAALRDDAPEVDT